MIYSNSAVGKFNLLITSNYTKVYIGKKPQKEPRKKPLKLRCLGGFIVLENHKKDQ